MIENKHCETLEFQRMLKIASSFCVTAAGEAAMLKERPRESKIDAERSLELTREAFIIGFEMADQPVAHFDAIDGVLDKVNKGGVLEIAQLLKVLRLLSSTRRMKERIQDYTDDRLLSIRQLAEAIPTAEALEEALDRSILNETELSDEASEKLASSRAAIRLQQSRIKDKLNSYMRGAQYASALQDRIVTMRDNRYVLPVKSEYKFSIPGIVHDTSDSGATCYIEPMAVVEMNNKLREAVVAEQEEVARILYELSRRVADASETLSDAEYYGMLFDVIFAKAKYAESIKGISPELSDRSEIQITCGRHPLLDPKKVVPTTVSFGNDKNILLISGPNTGGKTVVLKTIGLFCLMAYTGFFVPAEKFVTAYYDAVYCDIGDHQSLEESLSTFSSHFKQIVEITERADEHSLILLDELGAGTDPTEGSALAVAIIKYLAERRMTAAVTTHFSELKEFGLTHPYVLNAGMEFDAKTLRPTYKLKLGLPGVSNALNIAALLGLNHEILAQAKTYIGEGRRTFEEVLQKADFARTEAEQEKERLIYERKKMASDIELLQLERARVDAQFEKLTERAHAEVERVVGRSLSQAEDTIRRMEELLKDVNAENLLKAKQLRTSIASMEAHPERESDFLPLEEKDMVVGETVIVKSLNASGKIKTLPDKRGRMDIAVGNMVLKLTADDLCKQNFQKKQEEPAKKRVTHTVGSNAGALVSEINLLGQTVDEAVLNVDAFIDAALMRGLGQVKVIHGVGTGALRKGISQHLKRHPSVAEFRQGAFGEGGYGVTIVTLK